MKGQYVLGGLHAVRPRDVGLGRQSRVRTGDEIASLSADPASTIAEQTYLRMQNLYLRPQEVDERVLTGALEALETRFDPIRYESNGHSGTLSPWRQQGRRPRGSAPAGRDGAGRHATA